MHDLDAARAAYTACRAKYPAKIIPVPGRADLAAERPRRPRSPANLIAVIALLKRVQVLEAVTKMLAKGKTK